MVPGHPLKIEQASLTAKRGTNKTVDVQERILQIDSELALWLAADEETIIIPAAALRSCLEAAARKTKQGPNVREGLYVENDAELEYDREKLGKTIPEVAKNAAYDVTVVVQRNRTLRRRPRFEKWAATFFIDTDPELVDQVMLQQWLDVGGRRIGIGDWRPQKSGHFGRFSAVITEI